MRAAKSSEVASQRAGRCAWSRPACGPAEAWARGHEGTPVTLLAAGAGKGPDGTVGTDGRPAAAPTGAGSRMDERAAGAMYVVALVAAVLLVSAALARTTLIGASRTVDGSVRRDAATPPQLTAHPDVPGGHPGEPDRSRSRTPMCSPQGRDEADAAALDDVAGLELRLLDPQLRREGQVFQELLHPDFIEFGASGRRWTRDAVTAPAPPPPHPPKTYVASGLHAVALARDVVLVTYTATSDGAATRRSSVWTCEDGRAWRMRFQQGTPIPKDHVTTSESDST